VHILHKVLPHSSIVLWFGSIWVAWQPHQKCGLSVGGYSPREVTNPSALSCDDKMRRSRLNSGGGPVEVKTYTLHKLFMHHYAFDLIVCHLTVSLLVKLFKLYLEFLKNIILLFVVLSSLSCQTHPFSPKSFQMIQ